MLNKNIFYPLQSYTVEVVKSQYMKIHHTHNQGHMQINYIFGKELTALCDSGVFHGILFVPGLVTLFLSSPFSICRSWPLTADA